VCIPPPIVALQRLIKNPLIVARQRLCKNPPIVARQRLGRNVIAVTNTHPQIEELLDASFSMGPLVVSRQVGDQYLPELRVPLLVCFLMFPYFGRGLYAVYFRCGTVTTFISVVMNHRVP
jgi:hypothetical protein